MRNEGKDNKDILKKQSTHQYDHEHIDKFYYCPICMQYQYPKGAQMRDQYRILIPSEWEALKDSIEKSRLRIVVEGLLFTGMRYSEYERFSNHLEWFDVKNRAISLPAKASKTGRDRTIHLTPQFTKDMSLYLREHKKLEVPSIQAMNMNLRRWHSSCALAVDDQHPNPKTFRKTWESWLLASYPDRSMAIALSQGHSELISYGHYMNLDPRLKSEMDRVRELTKGWGI